MRAGIFGKERSAWSAYTHCGIVHEHSLPARSHCCGSSDLPADLVVLRYGRGHEARPGDQVPQGRMQVDVHPVVNLASSGNVGPCVRPALPLRELQAPVLFAAFRELP
jgi:hypothetical protein